MVDFPVKAMRPVILTVLREGSGSGGGGIVSGSKILTGLGPPDDSIQVEVGVLYLDTTSGKIYKKES